MLYFFRYIIIDRFHLTTWHIFTRLTHLMINLQVKINFVAGNVHFGKELIKGKYSITHYFHVWGHGPKRLDKSQDCYFSCWAFSCKILTEILMYLRAKFAWTRACTCWHFFILKIVEWTYKVVFGRRD